MLAMLSLTTEGTVMDRTPPTGPPGALLAADVARLFTGERRKSNPAAGEYKTGTVHTYLIHSSSELMNGRKRRYADNPMPHPRGYLGAGNRFPWWSQDQAAELVEWFHSRAGQGHGRGGWPAGRPRRKA